MRILVVADFHGLPIGDKNLSRFLQRAYDCLILIGDLTDFGPVSIAEDILARVETAKVPTFAIPGNCDPKSIIQVLEKYHVNLHCKSAKLDDVTFVGFGGSNITPFNTPFEFTEEEIKEELENLTRTVDENWVLVTHAPPHGTNVDQTSGGQHAGSKSIKQLIQQKQPLAAFCAHIHEARSTDKLGRTLAINPGPIKQGYAAEVEIAKGVQAKLLQLWISENMSISNKEFIFKSVEEEPVKKLRFFFYFPPHLFDDYLLLHRLAVAS